MDASDEDFDVKEVQNITKDSFQIPYSNRFEEGEFHKSIQLMYGGKPGKIRFKYAGRDVGAILPTAAILIEENGVYTISAEVFGKGMAMWIRSQGRYVTVIE